MGSFWWLEVKNVHGLPKSEKWEAQERLRGAEGGPKWVQVGPRARQGCPKGARREPKRSLSGSHFG